MIQSDLVFVAIIVLLAMGIAALIISRRTQRATGLPEGRLIYSDTTAWHKVNRAYFDSEWGLAGKPDYVIDVRGVQIPVEVKSSQAKHPYDSHILQLAAYCRLIQVNSGVRPPMGLIKYQDRVFEIAYSEFLEKRLEALISEVRSHDGASDLTRSHNSPARCAGCGYRSQCDQSLNVTNSNQPKKI